MATDSRGSSIRVKLKIKEGQSAPRIALFASSLEEPRYTRYLNSWGQEEIVLRGLGRGRFSLLGHGMMGIPDDALIRREVELDGMTDLTIELEP